MENKVEFLCGDSVALLRSGRLPLGDVLFLSPPWGGPEYLSAEVFDLNMPVVRFHFHSCRRRLLVFYAGMRSSSEHGVAAQVAGHSCADLIRLGIASYSGVVAFLPRNVHPKQVAEAVGGAACELECNFLNSKLKTVTLYIGDAFARAAS